MKKEDDNQATITAIMSATASKTPSGQQFLKKTSIKNSTSNTDRSVQSKNTVKIAALLRHKNMLVAGSQLGQESLDEYRRIKRPLLSNAFGKTASTVEHGNLILVTSSVPGEGKTHTSINLALSIAKERDHTVLLVDCDVARHGTSNMLDIADREGLIEILEGGACVSDVILRTDIPELCLLSAGRGSDDVSELLSSQRMIDFVLEIGTRYDDRVIIFDAPPLLATPQTQVLAEHVGQVVFVIEAGSTEQSQVEEAIDLLAEDQAVGIVINKSEGLAHRGYYGYYDSQ